MSERSSNNAPDAVASAAPKLRHSVDGFVEEDGPLRLIYQPRTVLGLCLILAVIVYNALRDAEASLEARLRSGSLLCAFTFLGYGAIQFRDSLMVRPHPVVWRVIHAAGILFLMLIAFLLMLNIDDVRAFLHVLDPELGFPLEDKNYGVDCRLYHPGHPKGDWHVLWDTINDPFMLAHLLGHFGHALIVRDWVLCTVISVGFEILECSLQHILPNFQECWWDHLILDIFGMNLIGIVLGLATVRLFSNKQYNWIFPGPEQAAAGTEGGEEAGNDQPGTDDVPLDDEDEAGTAGSAYCSQSMRRVPSKTTLKQVARQFAPRQVSKYDWALGRDWRILYKIIFAIALLFLSHLNIFFIKWLLWIPPEHPYLTFRLVLKGGLALHCFREYYEFCCNRNVHRLGQNAWLLAIVTISETILVLKLGVGQFHHTLWPAPYILQCWGLSIVAFLAWSVWRFALRGRFVKNRSSDSRSVAVLAGDMLLYLSFAPLLYILGRDLYRTYTYAEAPSELAPVGLPPQGIGIW